MVIGGFRKKRLFGKCQEGYSPGTFHLVAGGAHPSLPVYAHASV